MEETIVAIATAPGRGGIGVIRISGVLSVSIATTLCQFSTDKLRPRFAYRSDFFDRQGQLIDSGLVLFFQSPSSFTGEDVIELHGHGGPVVLDLLLARCLELGARLARPGEFSERAFLNNKIDLSQAEAIADLIEARSVAAARAAIRSLQGAFSSKVTALLEGLIQLRMHIEAFIDFPEEDIDLVVDTQVFDQFKVLNADFDRLLTQTHSAALLREGMNIAIVGRPNAGKSSLLNALVGRESAIVTPLAGTTRDPVRESFTIDGIPVNLVDTAGLRETLDPIEQEGVRRTRSEINKADVVLLLVDGNLQEGTEPSVLWPVSVAGPLPDRPILVVRNKCDLRQERPGRGTGPTRAVTVSALTGAGLDELLATIREVAGIEDFVESSFLARRRHLDALKRAQENLQQATKRLITDRAIELVAEDLRIAQLCLGEITGEFRPDDLLGRIFGNFCIGK